MKSESRLFPGAATTVPLDRRASRRLVSRAFAPPDAPYGRPDVSHLLPADPPPPPAARPVGLVPLTPWAGKRWPPEHWADLRASLRASHLPTLLLCGPGEADEARRAAWREGTQVELTLKEFDLMLFLMKNPGKVFSRETLLDLVWGYGYQGDTRTVDVHIRRLREKLELDPSRPAYIITKWGVGYYFADED